MAESVVLGPGGGTTVQNPVGGPLTIKVRGEQTNGSMSVFESTVAPLEGPPLHTHAREDEVLYIIEGEFRFRLEENVSLAPARSIILVPSGTRHCFQNIGALPGCILVMFTPAGMEAFFERFASLPEDADFESGFRSIGREEGMDVVGPPLAVSHPL
ncbi:MAG: cupin domain-containing protein [Actinobacteria bacterium]|nr:cupin domain-containing protein [Actinomycetota bacterium]